MARMPRATLFLLTITANAAFFGRQRAEIDDALAAAEHDNNSAYFEPVPPPASLAALQRPREQPMVRPLPPPELEPGYDATGAAADAQWPSPLRRIFSPGRGRRSSFG